MDKSRYATERKKWIARDALWGSTCSYEFANKYLFYSRSNTFWTDFCCIFTTFWSGFYFCSVQKFTWNLRLFICDNEKELTIFIILCIIS